MTNTKQNLKDLLTQANMYEYKPGKYCAKGRYVLNHGEYDRPDYSIRKGVGSDDYYIYARYYYYAGTCYAPTNGDATEDVQEIAACCNEYANY